VFGNDRILALRLSGKLCRGSGSISGLFGAGSGSGGLLFGVDGRHRQRWLLACFSTAAFSATLPSSNLYLLEFLEHGFSAAAFSGSLAAASFVLGYGIGSYRICFSSCLPFHSFLE
jgi:hypothetical protein